MEAESGDMVDGLPFTRGKVTDVVKELLGDMEFLKALDIVGLSCDFALYICNLLELN